MLWTDGEVTGTKGLVPGLTGKYYRDCRKTEKLAWLNLDERVPILTQKERGIDHPVGRNQKWCVDRDEDKGTQWGCASVPYGHLLLEMRTRVPNGAVQVSLTAIYC